MIAEQQLPPSDRTEGPEAQAGQPSDKPKVSFAEKQRISGDQVNRATADLPDNERSAIRRLHAFYMEEGLSLGELASITGISQTSISQVFRNNYGVRKKPDGTVVRSSLSGLVDSINSFFELREKRGQVRKVKFTPNSLTRRIWSVADAAREFQRIGFVFGDTQIGKTAALEAYTAEHNHGSTIYVSMPTGGSLWSFQSALAKKLRISPQQKMTELRRRIMEAFDDRMLLIVDEAHRCIPSERSTSTRMVQSVEFVREIFDETHCGVVICATNVFRRAMEEGPLAKLLNQTNRRRLCAFQCPDRPNQADLNLFAADYGLPPSSGEARELEKRVVEAEALGMWLTLLRMGHKVAAQAKTPMQWGHVISAHAGLLSLEGRKS